MEEVTQSSPVNPAEAYERLLVTNVFSPVAEAVVSAAAPHPGARILDVATGTGIVLRTIAQRAIATGSMSGIDIGPAMLEVARSIAASQGLSIDCVEGSADSLPFHNRAFDRVYCQQALQFVPDKLGALYEMHRVLEDGGRAVIAVWQHLEKHPYHLVLDQAGVEHAGIHIMHDPFSLGDIATLSDLMKQAGFRDIRTESVSIVARSVVPMHSVRLGVTAATAAIPSLQKLSQDQKEDLINGVVQRVEKPVQQFISNGILSVDWHSNIAIGTR
jgi:ubiquinone/menaquinone biosynthesis C-methylase UbiE